MTANLIPATARLLDGQVKPVREGRRLAQRAAADFWLSTRDGLRFAATPLRPIPLTPTSSAIA